MIFPWQELKGKYFSPQCFHSTIKLKMFKKKKKTPQKTLTNLHAGSRYSTCIKGFEILCLYSAILCGVELREIGIGRSLGYHAATPEGEMVFPC